MEKLGKKAKDLITDFEGIITSKHIYLDGSVQYALQPTVDKEGKVRDIQYFDEKRILIIGHGITPVLDETNV